jgi:hypothetical protein
MKSYLVTNTTWSVIKLVSQSSGTTKKKASTKYKRNFNAVSVNYLLPARR